jgi:tRNA dimethylallyltransferase
MDRRIDRRVLSMIDAGLVAEVEGLLSKGLGPDAPGMTAVGYREIVKHLGGQCTLDQAVEEIRSSTRRYARRQLTWFRNQLPPHTVRVDALLPLGEQIRTVVEVWRNR